MKPGFESVLKGLCTGKPLEKRRNFSSCIARPAAHKWTITPLAIGFLPSKVPDWLLASLYSCSESFFPHRQSWWFCALKLYNQNHQLNWWFAPSPGRAYYRQPLKRHRKVCQSHFFYRPPVPLSRPVPAPIRCPARPSGGRHRPPLFAARSEYAERSDAREGECGRPGRPRRPSRLPGEGGPHGRPPARP